MQASPNAGGEEETPKPSRNKKCALTDASGRPVLEMSDNFFRPTHGTEVMDEDTAALLDGLSANLIRGCSLLSYVQKRLEGYDEILDDRNKAIKDVEAELKSKNQELLSTLQKLRAAEEANKAKDAALAELEVKIASLERIQKKRDVEMDKLKVRHENKLAEEQRTWWEISVVAARMAHRRGVREFRRDYFLSSQGHQFLRIMHEELREASKKAQLDASAKSGINPDLAGDDKWWIPVVDKAVKLFCGAR